MAVPQGLEFGNPLGFLFPTWNRRLDIWEIGALANFRVVKLDFPNGTRNEEYEATVFPFQFYKHDTTVLNNLFMGVKNSRNSTERSWGVMGGFFGKVGFLQIAVSVEYDVAVEEMSFVLGIVDKF